MATIEPREDARPDPVPDGAHLDASRSGLLFEPARRPAQSLDLDPIARHPHPPGRAVAGAPHRRPSAARRSSRGVCLAGLFLLAERELRGDIPEANDNASGVGVVAQLAAEAAGAPPRTTRLVVLLNGCR